MSTDPSVGVVLGTERSTPLVWWVAVGPDAYLQLDDVVLVRTRVPGYGEVRLSGVVDMVRAQHEGSRFESDVFLAEEGVLPLEVARSARVVTTRVEPELWVPPRPGDPVERVRGAARDEALHFDAMEEKLAVGLSRDGQPVYIDMAFLDGRRGAHVNISGISGVATKTSYAGFLLYSLFHSGVLGAEAANTKALIFNVKGEDLLFLDRDNRQLQEESRQQYRQLGLRPGPFESVGIWAPVQRSGGTPVPSTGSRQRGVRPYFWTVRDVVRDRLLRFLFAEAGDERSQIADLVARVESKLDQETEDLPDHPSILRWVPPGWREGAGRGSGGGVTGDGGDAPEDAEATATEGDAPEGPRPRTIRSFEELCELVEQRLADDGSGWAGYIAGGTVAAFLRRLQAARFHCGHLIRGSGAADVERHRVDWEESQVSVIDINSLHDRAKRFVVGVVVKKLFEARERSGSARPLVFLVLDELNKYAPREGWSPIKEVLLDIAERGRSLGVILIGAQQTASEVERRVVANAAIRVVGRLDPAESGRAEYGFLSDTARQRATLLKPGTMMLQQPQLPLALEVGFPFPSWATRASEAADAPGEEDPFGRFDR